MPRSLHRLMSALSSRFRPATCLGVNNCSGAERPSERRAGWAPTSRTGAFLQRLLHKGAGAAALIVGLGLGAMAATFSPASWAQGLGADATSQGAASGRPAALMAGPNTTNGNAAASTGGSWFTANTEPARAVVQTPQVVAELVAWAPQGVAAGQTVWAGLRITHQAHWHTYWKNPGDSGLPTELAWTLPEGLAAGDILWPVPQKIRVGHLANFGFEGNLLLPVPLAVSPQFRPNAPHVDLQLHARWLVCKEECIPQEGRFQVRLPVRGSTAQYGAEFEAAQRNAPQPLVGQAQLRVSESGLLLSVTSLPNAWKGKGLDVFPETANILENPLTPQAKDRVGTQAPLAQQTGAEGEQTWRTVQAAHLDLAPTAQAGRDGLVWQAILPLSRLRSEAPPALDLWVHREGQAFRMTAPVVGTWPAAAVAGPSAISPALQAALDSNAAAQNKRSASVDWSAWMWSLGAALLGGVLLNLMPCVFPVLGIKVLAFARPQAGLVRQHRLEGLAYTAGVVGSLLALGGVMLALRAGGEQLGWGFQLQSPWVVAVLALLFTLISLNLMGLLEWRGTWSGRWAHLQLRHPVLNAGLTGVLAVAVASPCTAPFMGASLGLAITLPAPQALAIFAALGLGLALPFLLASWVPAFARSLPRPGAWMTSFRQLLAFPMWATVVWLLWVHGHLTSVNGAFSLLALLLGVVFLVWSLGQKGRAGQVLVALALALLVWLATWLLPSMGMPMETSRQQVTNEAGPMGRPMQNQSGQLAPSPENAEARSAVRPTSPAGDWTAWSGSRVQEALAQGYPVFVDFTAAWCITCQYNKSTTLSDPAVLADFAARKVVLLRADWTRRDPAISQALNDLGRSGVPVYVLFAPGKAPVVMSEFLQADTVQQALKEIG